jgi:hypothetical protein
MVNADLVLAPEPSHRAGGRDRPDRHLQVEALALAQREAAVLLTADQDNPLKPTPEPCPCGSCDPRCSL